MLKIYGLDFSPWVNRVRFTANQIGLDYDYISVDLLGGEGQSPEYKQLHPAGKVPVIDDDGFVLFESGAICRYLATKSTSPLYPNDVKSKAIVDQWTDYSVTHIAMAMQKVLFNSVIYKFMDKEQDKRSLEEGQEFLQRFLPIIDTQLSSTKYLAGDSISLADMILLAWLDPAEITEFDLSPHQHICTWRDQLKQESFYTKCYLNYQDLFQ
jgi:glutathione S-transferase